MECGCSNVPVKMIQCVRKSNTISIESVRKHDLNILVTKTKEEQNQSLKNKKVLKRKMNKWWKECVYKNKKDGERGKEGKRRRCSVCTPAL